MAHFSFKARRRNGDIYNSQNDAKDRYDLYHMIREKGDELVSFQEKKQHSWNLKMEIGVKSNKVKMPEKIALARNLGSMLEAGLALSRALSVLERQTKSKGLKEVLKDLQSKVDRGMPFSQSLGEHPKIFPPVFVSMVHAGEQSGNLSESLKTVATQMESSYLLEKRVKGALIYPSVIVSLMVVIGILMFIFVVPTLTKTFTDLNVQLPFATRVIVGISDVIKGYGAFVAIGLGLVALGIWRWKKSTTGKRAIDGLLLRLPLIGSLVQEVNSARSARTLSSLIGSGVDIVDSVQITGEVVQNVYFKDVLLVAAEAIKKGDVMSKVFAGYDKLYPAFFSEMLTVGEETGKTGEMLLGVARYYEEDVDQKTKNMSTIIEPFLMVVIGVAVGLFAVSMIQPMYSLVDAI